MNTMLLVASNTLQFVLALYVLKETGSATMFSAMLSVIIVPRMVVTPFAGIWGDKYNKKIIVNLSSCIYFHICSVCVVFKYYFCKQTCGSICFCDSSGNY